MDYVFNNIDNLVTPIGFNSFPVAWVKADKNHIEDCKAAIGFWLT